MWFELYLGSTADGLCSTPTFQLSYSQHHSHIFFDQVFLNTISGFIPHSNSPDSNWGYCLQCAAFDRARLKAIPKISRSAFCSQCFLQYCFNPQNLSSSSDLPNRKLVFVDPNPEGLTKIQSFLGQNIAKLIGGLLGILALIGLIIAMYVIS